MEVWDGEGVTMDGESGECDSVEGENCEGDGEEWEAEASKGVHPSFGERAHLIMMCGGGIVYLPLEKWTTDTFLSIY